MTNEKDYLIENLSMLLSSGMDVISALSAIKAEMRSKKMIATIDSMIKSLEGGSPIWKALEASKLLPEYIIALVRVGEETGKLPENLKVIIIQQQKDNEFKSKIKSAVMYPLFVFSLTFVVGIGIAWFILPRLALVFSQLRLKLPLITQVLISIGLFLGQYGIIVIPSLLLAFFGLIYLIFINKKTRFIGENILFKLPVFGELIREIEISRMGFLLGTLLSSGIPVIDSFSSLVSATTSNIYKKLYLHMQDMVAKGNSFQKSLSLYKDSRKLIPIPIQQLIITSEQSGNLPETFLKIGQNFESKIEDTTKNLSVMLEPILLIIVWLGVLAVALAVILPIYSLIGGLNK